METGPAKSKAIPPLIMPQPIQQFAEAAGFWVSGLSPQAWASRFRPIHLLSHQFSIQEV